MAPMAQATKQESKIFFIIVSLSARKVRCSCKQAHPYA
jgi:hypothetical protein